jgi:addiction module RelE/StbE family toxin
MKIIWSERALAQIREIFHFISEDRPLIAERILEGLLERVELLVEFPEQGAVWGGSRRPDLRSIVVGSYRILYRIRSEEIAILSVRHTCMHPEAQSEDPEP